MTAKSGNKAVERYKNQYYYETNNNSANEDYFYESIPKKARNNKSKNFYSSEVPE